MDPGNASAYVPCQMVRWSMRPRLATCAKKKLANWRKAKLDRACAEVSVAVAEETPVYMLCKENQ